MFGYDISIVRDRQSAPEEEGWRYCDKFARLWLYLIVDKRPPSRVVAPLRNWIYR